MAENILLKKEEVQWGPSNDKQLVRYRHFESYDGIKQGFNVTTYPSVYYPDFISTITNFTNTGYYDRDGYGCEVANYQLGTTTPSSPKRNEILRDTYYRDDIYMFLIPIHNPGDEPEDYYDCIDVDGNRINFKYKAWIGWKAVYNASGNPSYNNPVLSANTLANVKTSLSVMYPYNHADAYAFGHFYQRYSQNGISGLTYINGTSASSKWFQAIQGNYVVNGCTKTITRAIYKGDGYSSVDSTSAFMDLVIPGDPYDTTDPDTYFIYGYAATSKKLYPYSYIQLSNNYHSTHLMLNYIGDDNDFYNSGGQTTNSKSGFLNFSSGAQDRNDGLRYIYKFCSQFNRGYCDNSDEWLNLSGIVNNTVFVTCGCGVSCSPTGVNYTINMRYSFQVLDNNNNVLQTTGTFTHSINVGTVTGYSTTFYDASTVVIQEYPTYYKIKITKIEWSRDNTTYSNYINCNLVKSIPGRDGSVNFNLIVYDPPIMQNPW